MFFFIVGIRRAARQLGTIPNTVCPACSAYTRLDVSVTYSVFSLFFIPLIKWRRRYFAAAPCCGAVFEIDPEAGRDFERGRAETIDPSHLHKTAGHSGPFDCPYCATVLPPDARYCYHCGRPMR